MIPQLVPLANLPDDIKLQWESFRTLYLVKLLKFTSRVLGLLQMKLLPVVCQVICRQLLFLI